MSLTRCSVNGSLGKRTKAFALYAHPTRVRELGALWILMPGSVILFFVAGAIVLTRVKVAEGEAQALRPA